MEAIPEDAVELSLASDLSVASHCSHVLSKVQENEYQNTMLLRSFLSSSKGLLRGFFQTRTPIEFEESRNEDNSDNYSYSDSSDDDDVGLNLSDDWSEMAQRSPPEEKMADILCVDKIDSSEEQPDTSTSVIAETPQRSKKKKHSFQLSRLSFLKPPLHPSRNSPLKKALKDSFGLSSKDTDEGTREQLPEDPASEPDIVKRSNKELLKACVTSTSRTESAEFFNRMIPEDTVASTNEHKESVSDAPVPSNYITQPTARTKRPSREMLNRDCTTIVSFETRKYFHKKPSKDTGIQSRQLREQTSTEMQMPNAKKKFNDRGVRDHSIDSVEKESFDEGIASSEPLRRQKLRIECSSLEKTSRRSKSKETAKHFKKETSIVTVNEKRSVPDDLKTCTPTPTPIDTPNDEELDSYQYLQESHLEDDLVDDGNIISILRVPPDARSQESVKHHWKKKSPTGRAEEKSSKTSFGCVLLGSRTTKQSGRDLSHDGTGDKEMEDTIKRSKKELLKSCIVETNPEMSKLVNKNRIVNKASVSNASLISEATGISNKELLKAFIGSKPSHVRRHASLQKSKTPPIRTDKGISKRKKESVESKKDPPRHTEKETFCKEDPPRHLEKEPLLPKSDSPSKECHSESPPNEHRVKLSSSVKSAACLIGMPNNNSISDDGSSSSEESRNVQMIEIQQYPGLADSALFHALDPWVSLIENDSFDAYTYASSVV